MIRIDEGMMYNATSSGFESIGGPEDIGFLNRMTGELVFVYADDSVGGAADRWAGPDAGMGSVHARTRIDASPEEWVEVPKYRTRRQPCEQDEFIRNFLAENGIEAELV